MDGGYVELFPFKIWVVHIRTDRHIEHGTRCSEDALFGSKHQHRQMYIYKSLQGQDAEARRPVGAQ